MEGVLSRLHLPLLSLVVLTVLVLAACPTPGPGPGTGPSAPTGVAASALYGEVTVSWSAVTGATSYNLYWSTSTGVTTANGTKVAGATTPYKHTGLTNGTPYYYLVTAVDASGESVASSVVTATPLATLPTDAPSGVTATTPVTSQVTITWPTVTGATSYNLYRSTTTPVAITVGNQISTSATSPYNDTTGVDGTPYYYAVTAVDGGGESAASSEVSAAPAPYIQAELIVSSADGTTVIAQSVTVLKSFAGTPITNATVKVGATALTQGTPSSGIYNTGSVSIGSGSTINVTVSLNGSVYSATGTQFSSFPTGVSPAASGSWSISASNTISWTAPSGGLLSGAEYVAEILNGSGTVVFPVNGNPYFTNSSTSVPVPASTLATTGASTYTVDVGMLWGSGGNGIPIMLNGSAMTPAEYMYLGSATANTISTTP